jgi:hypothetical protein
MESRFEIERSAGAGEFALQLHEWATAADVAETFAAVDSLLAAAAFIGLGSTPRGRNSKRLGYPAELVRQDALRSPLLWPVRDAFGPPERPHPGVRVDVRWRVTRRLLERASRRDPTSWKLSNDEIYGRWLRRTLREGDAWEELFAWAEVVELRRESPAFLKIAASAGTLGAGAAGFAILGPFGLIPAGFFGIAGASVALWKQISEGKIKAAEAKEKAAKARGAEQVAKAEDAERIAKAELQAQIYKVAGDAIKENPALRDLAVKTALGATVDLGTSPAVANIQVTAPPPPPALAAPEGSPTDQQ